MWFRLVARSLLSQACVRAVMSRMRSDEEAWPEPVAPREVTEDDAERAGERQLVPSPQTPAERAAARRRLDRLADYW